MTAAGRVTLALAALLGGAALALPKYRLQAAPQLHLTAGNDLWQLDRRVISCTYCHVRESGGAPWNPFGQAIQATFRSEAEAGRAVKFPQALSVLLESGGDADSDGYPDALEVFARTLPGDPDSRPERPVADLQVEFDAAGGAAQFAPPAPGGKGDGNK
ncbi:hypothetical protein [Deinococcus knuensis]|uniref:hypothetical protein n=1 Tax=Deinococcus knuensis TaxID=1837380 RepID=UPI00166F1109|nr:hypothetical protein [Deinococcus knuensis]